MRRYNRKSPRTIGHRPNQKTVNSRLFTGVSRRGSMTSVTAVVALANGRKAEKLRDAGDRVVYHVAFVTPRPGRIRCDGYWCADRFFVRLGGNWSVLFGEFGVARQVGGIIRGSAVVSPSIMPVVWVMGFCACRSSASVPC